MLKQDPNFVLGSTRSSP